MKSYPINQIFYSLQGEGQWTGTPMLFIRLSGCNLHCPFCDTPDQITDSLTQWQILDKLVNLNENTKRVLITGGEPTIHDLFGLVETLRDSGYTIHLETNGSQTEFAWQSKLFDWVSLSPKTAQLSEVALYLADEVKFLVGIDNWREKIQTFMNRYRFFLEPEPLLYLMPLADGQLINNSNVQDAIDYCLTHPEFSLTLQTHKIIGVK